MTKEQQDLDKSVGRNVQERIKYIKENGDGYVEIQEAYRELWQAVENGTVDKQFFKLREKARKLL